MIPTKDLQLGDWVRIYDIEQDKLNATGRIWEIKQEDVTVDTDGTDEGMWYSTEHCLQPIPITPEMLKKDGWFFKTNVWVKKGPIRLSWYPHKAELIVGYHTLPFAVEFVHQLQHIQKMYGLEEIKL